MWRIPPLAAIMAIATALSACTAAGGHTSEARPSQSGTTSAASSPTPSPTPSPASSPGESVTASAAERPADPAADPAAVLAGMSVEEKVGQLFMPVLYGSAADTAVDENRARYGAPTAAEMIARYRPGGVILFPWADNIKNVRQVVDLTNALQAASPKVPLLVAIDQENGTVSRLRPLVTDLPGSMTIGETGDVRLARAAARVTGTELLALGFNLDFAPVADVNLNPANPIIGPRAYGTRPAKVAPMVAAAVRGFHDAGVAATAKHFPGHGDTDVDSHTGLPMIQHSRAQWARLDAPPFKAAIAEGVDAIMTAHVVMPKLDSSGDPATLSRPVLTGLLRDRLGFDGVVTTDALDMAGVRKKYDDAEVPVRAVLAGADLLLMPPDFRTAYKSVLAAVKSGRISQDRLDTSVLRLLKLKAARGILAAAPVADAGRAAKVLKSAAHLRVAETIARRAREATDAP